MANFGSIIEWVLRLEDRTLRGEIVNLGDGAGLTRFGITSNNWDGAVPPTYFTTMPVENALMEAKDFYYGHFWQPLQGIVIQSDVVAAELLAYAINSSVRASVALLQVILRIAAVDGVMGPNTLAAVNGVDGDTLAAEFRDALEAKYEQIVATHPADQRFLRGWENRAGAIYPDLPK